MPLPTTPVPACPHIPTPTLTPTPDTGTCAHLPILLFYTLVDTHGLVSTHTHTFYPHVLLNYHCSFPIVPLPFYLVTMPTHHHLPLHLCSFTMSYRSMSASCHGCLPCCISCSSPVLGQVSPFWNRYWTGLHLPARTFCTTTTTLPLHARTPAFSHAAPLLTDIPRIAKPVLPFRRPAFGFPAAHLCHYHLRTRFTPDYVRSCFAGPQPRCATPPTTTLDSCHHSFLPPLPATRCLCRSFACTLGCSTTHHAHRAAPQRRRLGSFGTVLVRHARSTLLRFCVPARCTACRRSFAFNATTLPPRGYFSFCLLRIKTTNAFKHAAANTFPFLPVSASPAVWFPLFARLLRILLSVCTAIKHIPLDIPPRRFTRFYAPADFCLP